MTDNPAAIERARSAIRLRLIRHREMREARDQDIVRARVLGIGPAEIGRLIGLDRSQVYYIVQRTRGDKAP